MFKKTIIASAVFTYIEHKRFMANILEMSNHKDD
jgi:hypothetical protein